jgi:hypothetical protein
MVTRTFSQLWISVDRSHRASHPAAVDNRATCPSLCWRGRASCPNVRHVDPETTPDNGSDRDEPTTRPTAPAPRSSRPRTPARPPARPVTDDIAETHEFGDGFRLGEIRPVPGVEVAAPERDETTVPSNIYRARRPAAAAMLVIPAVLFGLLLVRALAISAFGGKFAIQGVLASSLGLASLPFLVAGLYGLITGAAYGAEQWGFKVWAKPPLAYLLVGVSFLAIAGLAIR